VEGWGKGLPWAQVVRKWTMTTEFVHMTLHMTARFNAIVVASAKYHMQYFRAVQMAHYAEDSSTDKI